MADWWSGPQPQKRQPTGFGPMAAQGGGVLDQLGIVPPQQDTPDRNGVMHRLGQGASLLDYWTMGIPSTAAGLVNGAIPYQPLGELSSIKGNAETARSDLARSGGADLLALPDAFMGAMPGAVPMAPTAARMAPPAARQAGRLAEAAIDPIYQAMPSNSVGMFGGKLAKTADTAALAKAEDMAAKGMPREQIWNDTGWFQGVDGKWRFEIDDSRSAATPQKSLGFAQNKADVMLGRKDVAAAMPEKGWGGAADLGMQHELLYAAYPDMRSQYMAFLPGNSPRLNGAHGVYGKQSIGINKDLPPTGPNGTRSVQLHEWQHGAQGREGFARGGNSKEFATMSSQDAYDAYKKLAGEVEARAVQKRRDMTADQRRARAPWLDYDVPEANQIVRFGQ